MCELDMLIKVQCIIFPTYRCFIKVINKLQIALCQYLDQIIPWYEVLEIDK